MSFPDHAFTIRGGCNCRAIRWRANIPELSRRPMNIFSQNAAETNERLPMTVMDHCNDCRRASGNVASVYMCIPAKFMTVSLLRPDGFSQNNNHHNISPTTTNTSSGGRSLFRSRKAVPAKTLNFASDASLERYGTVEKPEDGDYTRRGPWMPALSVLRPNLQTSAEHPFLRFYESSGDVVRTFCGRCGTPLMYAMSGAIPADWPEMYDVFIGTIDQEFLNEEWMKPQHHCFWDYGLPWVKSLVTGASNDIPIHPQNDIDFVCSASAPSCPPDYSTLTAVSSPSSLYSTATAGNVLNTVSTRRNAIPTAMTTTTTAMTNPFPDTPPRTPPEGTESSPFSPTEPDNTNTTTNTTTNNNNNSNTTTVHIAHMALPHHPRLAQNQPHTHNHSHSHSHSQNHVNVPSLSINNGNHGHDQYHDPDLDRDRSRYNGNSTINGNAHADTNLKGQGDNLNIPISSKSISPLSASAAAHIGGPYDAMVRMESVERVGLVSR